MSFKWEIYVLTGTLINLVTSSSCPNNLQACFEKYDIVPDVTPVAPRILALVTYPSGATVYQGNRLTPAETKDQPTVLWEPTPNTNYLVAMVDLDVPSHKYPTEAPLLHWLVGNVHEMNVSGGEVLAEYLGPAPSKGSGYHRYTILVYEQPDYVDYNMTTITKTMVNDRTHFSIPNFTEKYSLGSLVAGNFFRSKYDKYDNIIEEIMKEDSDNK